ncbi:MAG TPA: thiamine pyrophosphate-dependent enzyme [Chloroflexota bacterium]|nr:thiamine pyrophosphate-dependent enzyme [Chloroflexota bacterium]
MAKKTTADLLIERLTEWGVDTIFGFPGDGINGIFEALRTHQDTMKFVQVRHEEAAAFAACGYAKFSGRLGVCLATSGPGGIHLLNGLYDAKCDGQPVLAITGHTFHDLIGTHYQQDVDLDKLFMDVAVYNERVMGPAHVVNVLDEAVKSALRLHGVAHLTIPKDIQEWTLDDGDRSTGNIAKHSAHMFAVSYPLPPEQYLRQAADLINAGKKVAILAGRGCLGARDEVMKLAEAVGGPIVKPLLGKGVVPDDSPYTTGGIGLLGTAPSQDAMEECDTLIMLGTSYPYMEFLPKAGQAKTVQVDRDSSRIGLRHEVEVGLVGDCQAILTALLPLIQHKEDRGFLKKAQDRMHDWNQLMEERGTRTSMPMKPQVAARAFNACVNDNAIVISDCGTVTTWAARHIQMRGTMQFSVSGLLATMACGLPYAVGAAMAFPGRQVVALCGDGGFTMLMGELATMVKYNLPVKVLIIKNNVLGEIKWEQMAQEGNPQFGVELQPIDFAAYARSCGAAGYCLDDPGKAESVMREAFAQSGPVVIEAVVDPNEPPLPGKISTQQAIKFAQSLARGEKDALGIIKTVLMDKIREVV